MSDPSNNNPAPPSPGTNTKPTPTYSTTSTGAPASPNTITIPLGNANGQTFIFSTPPPVQTVTWFGPNPFTDPVPAVPAVPQKKSDGCFCKKCKEFYPYAEPNQQDGTLICYGCRLWSGK